MECWCPISGRNYFSGDDFKMEPTVEQPLPIFSVPTRSLLARARKYGKGKYQESEEELLFLALLNKTGMVVWEEPGVVTKNIVGQYMEQVFRLVSWIDQIGETSLRLELPHYRVTRGNQDLRNIGVFITACYDVRKEFQSPALRKLKQDLLESREATLTKLIHSQRTTEQISSRLASWALDATDVKDASRRVRWTELFKLTPDTGIFAADQEELKRLHTYMLNKLYEHGAPGNGAGSLYAQKVMEHLGKLVKLAESGYAGFLGADSGPSATFKFVDTASEDEKLVALAEVEKKLVAKGAPKQQPKREDYHNRLSDWIRDRAAWLSSMSLREQVASGREQLGLGDY